MTHPQELQYEAWRHHQIEIVPLDDRRPILPPDHPLIRSTP